MLKSPKDYIKELESKTYEELLVERDKLIQEMKYFELNSKNIIKNSGNIIPRLEIVYELSFEHLAVISKLIARKFNVKN